MIRLHLPIAIAALLSASAASANIITVGSGDVGQSYTVNYDGFSDGKVIDGLTGQTTFKLTGVTGNSYSFDYQVANTSSDPIDSSRISIFGFNTDPNISSASSTGLFDQVASGNVPSGFGQVDLCFKGAGGNNCSGGAGEGVQMGDSTGGSFTLSFSEALDQLSLSNFFVRYQSINETGSAIGRGTVGGSTGGGSTGGGSTGGGSTGGTPVPAPAGFALFALAAAGVVGRRTRRA